MSSTNNSHDPSLLPAEDQWAATMAANLRLLLAAGADESAAQRDALIEDQVTRGLDTLPLAQRARSFERLKAHFPALSAAGYATTSAAATGPVPTEPAEVVAIVSDAWVRFSPEQREALREQLAGLGIADAPAEATDFSEVKKVFALAPNDPLVPQRFSRLTITETDFLIKVDQLAWSVWKQIAPQSPVKRENPYGDFRAMLRRYLKGDPEITDLHMAQQIERTRQLALSLMGALAIPARAFLKRYQNRYSPDAVMDTVKIEGGSGGMFSGPPEKKFWLKYVEFAADINEHTVQADMMESIARSVEDMMKAKKTGAAV